MFNSKTNQLKRIYFSSDKSESRDFQLNTSTYTNTYLKVSEIFANLIKIFSFTFSCVSTCRSDNFFTKDLIIELRINNDKLVLIFANVCDQLKRDTLCVKI